MDVTAEMRYPDSSVAAAVAMLFDKEFRTAVARATMAISSQVDVQPQRDGSTVVSVARTLPAEVPDIVKRFVGETIQLDQVETWAADDGSGTRRADVRLTVVGQPAAMTGTLVLEADGDLVRELLHGRLQVGVPFFGGRIEGEIAKAIVAAAREEERIGRAWLAR